MGTEEAVAKDSIRGGHPRTETTSVEDVDDQRDWGAEHGGRWGFAGRSGSAIASRKLPRVPFADLVGFR
jgi:hypothetical protein